MIFMHSHYNQDTKQTTYGFLTKNDIDRANIFETEEGVKSFLELHKVETFIIFSKTIYPILKGYRVINLAFDCSDNLSLQSFMGHTFKPISWDIKDELDTIREIYYYRQDYLNAKKELGDQFGIDGEIEPNRKLVEKIINIKKEEKTPFKYSKPASLTLDETDPVVQYFAAIDGTKQENYTTRVAGCMCDFSRGGVHGSLTTYSCASTLTQIIYYIDITSFYPSLIYYYDYLKGNENFNTIYHKHIEHKTEATKLFLNTISGVLELYQPNTALNMRITGQLLIYKVLRELEKVCPSFKLVNVNTDGFICLIDTNEKDLFFSTLDNSDVSKVSTIKKQEVKNIFIKDVNNLVIYFQDGTEKIVGYLNSGINTKGRFTVNNNYLVVKKAVLNALKTNSKIEDFINNDDDERDYQIITSGGDEYIHCLLKKDIWMLDEGKGVIYPLENRVYATTKKGAGTLKRVLKENGNLVKIPDLPEQCSIDNPTKIDKGFYIAKANKILSEYAKPNNKEKEVDEPIMAEQKNKQLIDVSGWNIYKKLLAARIAFLDANVQKSGYNSSLDFHYFTLNDIIPILDRIFYDYQIIGLTSFTEETATLTIVNIDDPDGRTIVFTSPMRTLQAIVSRTGNPITNDVQLLGSVETYERRYLYLVALDIIEPESIDLTLGNTPKSGATGGLKPIKSNIPSPQQKLAAKETIVGSDGIASDLQIQGLEKAINVAIEKNPNLKSVVNKLYADTDHLKTITKDRCEKYIIYFSEQVDKEASNGVAR